MVLRLSATNFSAPALLVNCHFDRCHHHNDLGGEEGVDDGNADNVDDDEELDDDGEDGYNHAQRSARSRGQRQHAQLCHHA